MDTVDYRHLRCCNCGIKIYKHYSISLGSNGAIKCTICTGFFKEIQVQFLSKQLPCDNWGLYDGMWIPQIIQGFMLLHHFLHHVRGFVMRRYCFTFQNTVLIYKPLDIYYYKVKFTKVFLQYILVKLLNSTFYFQQIKIWKEK